MRLDFGISYVQRRMLQDELPVQHSRWTHRANGAARSSQSQTLVIRNTCFAAGRGGHADESAERSSVCDEADRAVTERELSSA